MNATKLGAYAIDAAARREFHNWIVCGRIQNLYQSVAAEVPLSYLDGEVCSSSCQCLVKVKFWLDVHKVADNLITCH